MPCAYMVKCFDGTFYIGSAWSLERRIADLVKRMPPDVGGPAGT